MGRQFDVGEGKGFNRRPERDGGRENDSDLAKLSADHEDLINQIIEQEDELLRIHSAHIKLMSNLTNIVTLSGERLTRRREQARLRHRTVPFGTGRRFG